MGGPPESSRNQQSTIADHQRAFEEYVKCNNKATVARIIGVHRTTINTWSGPDGQASCYFRCPWHDWDKLIEQRREALDARLMLIETGNYDPVAHDEAVKQAVEPEDCKATTTTARRKAVDTLVRSDLEVLSHYELLYNRVFFEATGQPLPHPMMEATITDAKTGEVRKVPFSELTVEQMTSLYLSPISRALRCTNLNSAISTLIQLRDQIDKTKEQLGVKRKPLISAVEQQHENPATPALPADARQLSIEDLRRYRDLIENTPPEQLELLKKMLRADESEVAAVLNHPDIAAASVPVTVG